VLKIESGRRTSNRAGTHGLSVQAQFKTTRTKGNNLGLFGVRDCKEWNLTWQCKLGLIEIMGLNNSHQLAPNHTAWKSGEKKSASPIRMRIQTCADSPCPHMQITFPLGTMAGFS